LTWGPKEEEGRAGHQVNTGADSYAALFHPVKKEEVETRVQIDMQLQASTRERRDHRCRLICSSMAQRKMRLKHGCRLICSSKLQPEREGTIGAD